MLAVAVGVIAAALVVGFGLRLPVPGWWSGAGRGPRAGTRALFGPAALLSLLLLLAVLLGLGAARAGGMLLLVVVAVVVLMGSAALWAWLRLQIAG
jgi:hypothetical protein